MKRNIQVIDGAINSTFDVFEISFPNGRNVSFIDDFPHLENDAEFWFNLYSNKLEKSKVNGIHGTIHSTGSYVEKTEFPNRKESDVLNK
ncbi:hypothetical protein [Fictibacillus barbaricus]|uniref:Uncharacterized protein n=1 Tax=Fictibacillus barbaricus TaxID=182136 RepID=A0ABS2Z9B9_9BACL|nr:hypothetical protein [Fictibacillus barbaricus]MBN3543868.1 hypothetical protein [Fictibacillus barbaricus]GGB72058.1 hypothetical protein GCM10007199_42810 [Fictibacillus barbaricus]